MNELLIDLDFNAKTALYEQIYESIRRDIMDGSFSRGERLPSARQLAAGLQVSRSTVDAAYAQLVSEGYLMSKRGSGFYVCDIGELYNLSQYGVQDEWKDDRAHTGRVSGNPYAGHDESREDREKGAEKSGNPYMLQDQWKGNSAQISEESRNLTGHRIWKYNFLPGQIESSGFAYNAWRKSAKEALLELETRGELLSAGHPQGEYELRRVIAAYLYRARGVRCTPEQMIIGAGNEYLLQLLGQILGGPRCVAMESPTYLQAYHTFCNIGYEVSAVPMDLNGMCVEKIPKDGVTLAYVMPSHQFPLGCVMPLGRRMQLLAWAEGRGDCYIIEDDHDSEFRYKGRPIPSLQGIAHMDRVIYLGTFSNSIMPSIRISYMVLPPQLMRVYHKKCGFYASTVSRIQQMSVCRFIEAGCFERHLNKMRGIYKAKHDQLLQLLKNRTWVRRIYGDYAGLHMAVELDCRLPEAEIIHRAAEKGLLVQGMTDCYIAGSKKPDENPVLLLGFGDLETEQIREGVEVLEMSLKTAM